MKKFLFGILGLVGLVALAAGSFAAYIQITGIPSYPPGHIDLKVDVTPERVARGQKLAVLLCAECHKDPKSNQLTGKLMEDAPPQFGVIYSRNITQSKQYGIGDWTDGEIAYLIRTGVGRDGRYYPPWMVKLPHISDEDLHSIIAFLRSDDPMVQAVESDEPGVPVPTFFTKFLTHVAFKALPYPEKPILAPDQSDKVAFGRYLAVAALDCYGCHSADFATMNVAEPEKSVGFFGGGNTLQTLEPGVSIRTSNLTPDQETGIGSWTEEDFIRALRTGFRKDGSLIRYPMSPMPMLTVEEASAMWAYFQTIPPIKNKIDRKQEAAPAEGVGAVASADELTLAGRTSYFKYGCNACHGVSGVGIGDVRRAQVDFPTDPELEKWIRDAPSIRPNTRMPKWDGVIKEEDYAGLVRYVRELAKQPHS